MRIDVGTNVVLVTGAMGWLGRGLVHALVNGLADCPLLAEPQTNLKIRALVLPEQDAAELKQLSERIDVIKGDLRRREDCERFCAGAKGAILFHVAGIIHPRCVREFYEINVEGALNILQAAVTAGVRRAVAVSSNSPCGCNPHPDHLFDEDSPYNPYMNYGRSKMMLELAVKDRQRAGDIETVIIRPPWFYGPFQPPRQTLFIRMIRDGKMPIVGSGNNLRSMTYIDNLCQGLLLAAITVQAAGQSYWIADERPYSMNEVVDTVERLLETEFGITVAHKRLRLPFIAGEVATVADRVLQSLGLYEQKIHVLSEMNKTIACSVAKAQRELRYAPVIALEEGMRRSIRWVRLGL
jgi:nucleoside-diphosphate-sugar epimerase